MVNIGRYSFARNHGYAEYSRIRYAIFVSAVPYGQEFAYLLPLPHRIQTRINKFSSSLFPLADYLLHIFYSYFLHLFDLPLHLTYIRALTAKLVMHVTR